MSANAHKPIIAILILLVASFSSAHAAPHSGASAVNLVAPPPPSPNSYPAALYTVGSQRKLLLIRQLFTPEHVLYTPFPLVVCPVYNFTEQRPSFSLWAGWIRV